MGVNLSFYNHFSGHHFGIIYGTELHEAAAQGQRFEIINFFRGEVSGLGILNRL